MLGLMGTLIPMGPALVGLATGDIPQWLTICRYFATTVVGMVIARSHVITLQVKQRWYAREINDLNIWTRLCETKPMNNSQPHKNMKRNRLLHNQTDSDPMGT